MGQDQKPRETYLDPSDRFWSKPVAVMSALIGTAGMFLGFCFALGMDPNKPPIDRLLCASGGVFVPYVFFRIAYMTWRFGLSRDTPTVDGD